MTVVLLAGDLGQHLAAESVDLSDAGQIVGLRFALFRSAHTGGAHLLVSSVVGTIDSPALAAKQSVPVAAVRAALPPAAEDIVLLPPAGCAAQPAAAAVETGAHYAAAPWQTVSWMQLLIQALGQWVGLAGGCGSVGSGLPRDLSSPPHFPPSRRLHPIASRCG